MNDTNILIDILMNKRHKISEFLSQKGTYDNLVNIFNSINKEADDTIKIHPDSNWIYRLLTSQFSKCSFPSSEISWIPSIELVDGLINLARACQVSSIEELYTDQGILASMLKEKVSNILVTAADSFESANSCSKLKIIDIARRDSRDYKYYPMMDEKIPEMVICGFVPNVTVLRDSCTSCISDIPDLTQKIYELVESNNHKVIVLITINIADKISNILSFVESKNLYRVKSFHVKALDKFFGASVPLRDRYPSNLVANILIRQDVVLNDKIKDIMSTTILPARRIDCPSVLLRDVFYLHKIFPRDLFLDMIKISRIDQTLVEYPQITKLINVIGDRAIENTYVPKYVQKISDFLLVFDSDCVNTMPPVFRNKSQFDRFVSIMSIHLALSNSNSLLVPDYEVGPDYNIPSWITDINSAYKYIYLLVVGELKGETINRRTITRTYIRVCGDIKKEMNFGSSLNNTEFEKEEECVSNDF